ncbi:MAG: ribosome maturation factor RimM [Caldilineaceae bacterium]|nr:ribosome maturation factor RimM [Caldilineaceae bacterium]MCB9151468.1 ribosome maturation factor RimM [Caldilineaceae bacterium]
MDSTQPAKTIYIHRNQRVHVPDGYLAVGRVIGVHGLRGEVKVELHTDFPERFQPGLQLFLGEALQPVSIRQARPHKGHMLILFDAYHSRSAVENMRNTWLFVHEDHAIELSEDEYWVHDIVGLAVYTDDGQHLGQVADVLATGANDVYIVEPVGLINKGREILLPAIAEVIQQVDLAAGRLIVKLPEGILD